MRRVRARPTRAALAPGARPARIAAKGPVGLEQDQIDDCRGRSISRAGKSGPVASIQAARHRNDHRRAMGNLSGIRCPDAPTCGHGQERRAAPRRTSRPLRRQKRSSSHSQHRPDRTMHSPGCSPGVRMRVRCVDRFSGNRRWCAKQPWRHAQERPTRRQWRRRGGRLAPEAGLVWSSDAGSPSPGSCRHARPTECAATFRRLTKRGTPDT